MKLESKIYHCNQNTDCKTFHTDSLDTFEVDLAVPFAERIIDIVCILLNCMIHTIKYILNSYSQIYVTNLMRLIDERRFINRTPCPRRLS